MKKHRIGMVMALVVCCLSGNRAPAADPPPLNGELSAARIATVLGLEGARPAWADLFNADRTLKDTYDELGRPGSNGVPDFLDTWGSFRARRDAVFVVDALGETRSPSDDIGHAYAYTTFNSRRELVLYLAAERLSADNGQLEFVLRQARGRNSPGDLRVQSYFEGGLRAVTVRGWSPEPGAWIELARLGGAKSATNLEGCNRSRTVCATANPVAIAAGPWCTQDGSSESLLSADTFVELGLNVGRLMGAEPHYRLLRLLTASDNVSGEFVRARTREREPGIAPQPQASGADSLADPVHSDPNVNHEVISDTGACMEDVAGFSLNCTAEDIDIAETSIIAVIEECEFPGDFGTFQLEADFELNAQERHDLGIYLALDGGDALNGSCSRSIIPESPSPPFFDLDSPCDTGSDPCDPADLCGDVGGNILNVDMPAITVPCVDNNNDGSADLPACLSWRQPGANDRCEEPADAFPGTPSKCKCQVLDVPLLIPKILEVVKDLIPSDDSGLFDLQVDGTTEFDDASDGDTTGPVDVSDGECSISGAACDQNVDCGPTGGICDPFDRTVGEVAGTGTDLGDYTSSIECVNQLGTCVARPDLPCVNDTLCDTFTPGDTCDKPLNVVADCADCTSLAVEILPAQTVIKCTITNTLLGNVIVKKETDPDGSSQSFEFDPSYAANFFLTAGQQNDSGGLAPGTYSVAEVNIPTGWDLTSSPCVSSIGDTETAGSIELDFGETVTCTFNNRQDGKIIVDKVTDPAGDPQLFDFTASFDAGADPDFQLADGTAPFNSGDLAPGTYSVTETVPSGWDLTSATCDDGSDPSSIDLAAGETVTCTFNNQKDANIVVVKQTDPDGDPQVFDFSASYDADGFSLSDGQSNDSGDLDPGTYSVTETVPSGWDLTSATCDDGSDPSSIDLAAGETVTCTFNNRKRGTIIVEKQTIPDGATGSFTFTGDAAGSISDGGQIVVSNLVPGTYTSTESDPTPEFDLTSILCSDANSSGNLGTATATFNLEAGETVTCTFTNTQRGKVTVDKTFQGGAIPAGESFTFQLRQGASTLSDGTVLATEVVDETTVFPVQLNGLLVPGTYQVCEFILPGYDSTIRTMPGAFVPNSLSDPANTDNAFVCVPVTVAAGQELNLDIDNSPPPGGMAKTIGFWKNWSSCDGGGNQDPILDETLAPSGIFLWGNATSGFLVNTCPVAVDLLDKRKTGNPALVGDGPKMSSDAAYNMAAQLLAALLNIDAGAGTCPALSTAVSSAQALLQRIGFNGTLTYLPPNAKNSDLLGDPDPNGGTFTKGKLNAIRANAESLGATLDAYNNNLLCP